MKIPNLDSFSTRLPTLRAKTADLQVANAQDKAQCAIIRQRIAEAPAHGNENERRVQELLGDWDTGYTNYEGELYIFCNVGTAGRTGHDYPNRWDDHHQLVWSAKNRSHRLQPTMQAIAEGRLLPHVFWRSEDRQPFTYAGQGYAVEVQDTSPVVVRWSFPTVVGEKTRLSLNAIRIANALESRGFRLDRSYKKIWKATNQAITIYVKRDSDAYVLVVAPEFAESLDLFLRIPGVTRPLRLFYHNLNMHDYPAGACHAASCI